MAEGLSQRRYRGLPPEARQADRQQRFRAAGLELFATAGYLNSSVPEICRRAGLSTRQFYAEFSSREALIIDLYSRFQAQARGAVRSAFDEAADRDPRTLLTAALSAYFESLAGDPRVVLVEAVGLSAAVDEVRAEVHDKWLALVRERVGELVRDRGRVVDGAEITSMALVALRGAMEALALEWAQQQPRPSLAEALAVAAPIVESLLAVISTLGPAD